MDAADEIDANDDIESKCNELPFVEDCKQLIINSAQTPLNNAFAESYTFEQGERRRVMRNALKYQLQMVRNVAMSTS